MQNTLWKNPLAIVLISFALGCISQAVTASITVAAQSDPTAGVYRECFGVIVDRVTRRELEAGDTIDTVPIPSGWHVVGGGERTAVLCR